jgi:hypothetical protein
VAEVEGGSAVVECDVVGDHASVADATMAVGDEPGDGVFDCGPQGWSVGRFPAKTVRQGVYDSQRCDARYGARWCSRV